MKRAYFVVEGPHDVEVVGRLLRRRGLNRVQMYDDLDDYWHPLVPRGFPYKGDLLRRVPVPVFFSSAEASVAVHSAGGISRIGEFVEAGFLRLDPAPDGLGVLVDADVETAEGRWQEIMESLPVVDAGESPGNICDGTPRVGIFVLPDNENSGTLEDVLISCAEKVYPTLLNSAKAWIDPIDPDDRSLFRNSKEREDIKKPAGKSKAVVGCIAGVLRPGKAVQVSIQDNMWLRHEDSLALQAVVSLQEFVDRIVGWNGGDADE